MRESDGGIDRRIGNRVHALRAERNLTLDGLAGVAGVSRAMLSRIERGESSPTAHLLNKICGGLGITLPELFADVTPAVGPVSRRCDQPEWRDPASGYLRRAVSPPNTGSPVGIAEIELPARACVAFDAQPASGADQHIWLLEGALEIDLGEDRFRLEKGDCLMMRFDLPVLFRNPSRRKCRYAVVVGRRAGRP